MEYALIKNNTIENVIIADDEFITTIQGQYDRIENTETAKLAGFPIGCGIIWIEGENPKHPEIPTIITTEKRLLSKLGFRRRFTTAEKAMIELAAIDNPQGTTTERLTSAALRATLKDQEAADFIDLDDPDTIDGIQKVELAGFLAQGRANEILTAPIKDSEKP